MLILLSIWMIVYFYLLLLLDRLLIFVVISKDHYGRINFYFYLEKVNDESGRALMWSPSMKCNRKIYVCAYLNC